MLVALMSYSHSMHLTNLLSWFLDVDSMAADQVSPSLNVMNFLESVGVVESPIRIGKQGRIRVHGVYWSARSTSDRIIALEENVKVIGREGNTLIVEPIDIPQQLNLSWPETRVRRSS